MSAKADRHIMISGRQDIPIHPNTPDAIQQ